MSRKLGYWLKIEWVDFATQTLLHLLPPPLPTLTPTPTTKPPIYELYQLEKTTHLIFFYVLFLISEFSFITTRGLQDSRGRGDEGGEYFLNSYVALLSTSQTVRN